MGVDFMIQDKTMEEWIQSFPKIKDLINYEETTWFNNQLVNTDEALAHASLSERDILDAEARLKRFAPYIAHVFPETIEHAGIIESPLTKLDRKSTRLNSSHVSISYAVFCLKKKKIHLSK